MKIEVIHSLRHCLQWHQCRPIPNRIAMLFAVRVIVYPKRRSKVGGGFGKGIHNTLEAATYGVPVIFGPNHKKFKEALDLIEVGGGFAIESQHDFNRIMEFLWNPESNKELNLAGEASRKYVLSMCGATPLIMKELF